MRKLLKVTLEFNDQITMIEGEEAEKWTRHNTHVCVFAHNHGCNPFDSDPIKWRYFKPAPAAPGNE